MNQFRISVVVLFLAVIIAGGCVQRELTIGEDETLNRPYGVEVDAQNFFISPPRELRIPVTIENLGVQSDRINIEVATESSWANTSSLPSYVDLEGKQKTELFLQVTVPNDGINDTDRITVKASSGANPQLSVRLVITVNRA